MNVSRFPISRFAFYALLLAALLSLSVLAQAQSGGGYDLTWNSIDGGGGTAAGGSYTLDGAIGQPEAVGQVGNSPYTLVGGFWGGVSIANYAVYLPLVRR